MIDQHLEKAVVGETMYWNPPAMPAVQPSAHSAHLLPAFDEYNVAYKNRKLVLDVTGGAKQMTSSNALGPTIIVDGRIIGTWKGIVNRNKLTIAAGTSRDLKAREKRVIATAAEQYATFVDVPLQAFVCARA